MTIETDTDDVLGLYTPEVATYRDLSLIIETSTIEENAEGSLLAASLLELPEAFTQTTAAVVLDSVGFNIHSDEYRLNDEGELVTAREILAERFNELADIDDKEKHLPQVDTTLLDMVLNFAEEDVEAARDLYQDTAEVRREDQRQLSPVEKIRLLLAELKRDSQDVTVEQLLLAEDFDTATVAARAFPKAEELISALREQQLTPAEQRKQDRLQRAERERTAGAGNRVLAESNDLEIMLLLDEDPEATAAVALNTRKVDREQLFDVLENASDRMVFYWMFGYEVQQPGPGDIEAFVNRRTEDQVRTLAESCHALLAELEERSHGEPVPAPAWVVDIIKHVYVPRVRLDTATAALVWHELADTCGDDPSMWLAVLLADTLETPTRLQDIV